MSEQQVLAITNHKGGVGKTTTTVNLGVSLARRHQKRVLLIDIDPQGNSSLHLGLKVPPDQHTPAAKLLVGLEPLDALITATPFGVDLVRSGVRTALAMNHLTAAPNDCTILGQQIAACQRWDVVLIDCPPTPVTSLVSTALRAAKRALVPMQLQYFALEGFSDLLSTIERERVHNRELAICGWFGVCSDNSNLAKGVAEALTSKMPGATLQTRIRKDIRLAEAPSHAKPIFDYDPKCNGAADYDALAAELVDRGLV